MGRFRLWVDGQAPQPLLVFRAGGGVEVLCDGAMVAVSNDEVADMVHFAVRHGCPKRRLMGES